MNRKQAEALCAVVRGMSPRRTVRFPSIRDVARALRDLNGRAAHERSIALASGDEPNEEFGILDVRLQVTDDDWTIWDGDPSYDTDHRGFWGSTSLDGRRFNSRDVARDLINEAREAHAMAEPESPKTVLATGAYSHPFGSRR